MIIRISKKDIICLFIILSITLVVRVFLITEAPSLYGQDAYNYLNSAHNFASTGYIKIEAGFPFIVFLGVFLKLLTPIVGAIVASRLFMLAMTSLLVSISYFIGSKISGKLFGLTVALVATFEPYFRMYSIVPYNDVFAIAMGLLAFYCACLSNRLVKYLFSPVFFYIAIFTRLDLYFALILPVFIIYLFTQTKADNWRQNRFAKLGYCVLFAAIYLLPSLVLYYLAQPYGRLGIFERISLFLRPDLFSTVLNSSTTFSSFQLINHFVLLLAILGVVLSLLAMFVSVDISRRRAWRLLMTFRLKSCGNIIRRTLSSVHRVFALCLLLAFFSEVLALTIGGFNYSWAFLVDNKSLSNLDLLRQAVVITPELHNRYLILPMLLMGYPIAYPLYKVLRKVYVTICPK